MNDSHKKKSHLTILEEGAHIKNDSHKKKCACVCCTCMCLIGGESKKSESRDGTRRSAGWINYLDGITVDYHVLSTFIPMQKAWPRSASIHGRHPYADAATYEPILFA